MGDNSRKRHIAKAITSGIKIAESRIEKIRDQYHTFLTKRFDWDNGKRIYFASVMTVTGNTEDIIRDTTQELIVDVLK